MEKKKQPTNLIFFIRSIFSLVSRFWKAVKTGFIKLGRGIFSGFSFIRKKMIHWNFYRRFRESLVSRYLCKVVSVQDRNWFISWQPLFWVLIKIAFLSVLSYRVYLLNPIVANWLSSGLAFFRLDEIYNFQFPDKVFFLRIARYLLLILIGYYGLYFLFQQWRALFSTLIVDKNMKKIYYIDNTLFKKQIYIFSIPEIEIIALGQNIFFRPFSMGNIILSQRNGTKFVIPALKKAPAVIRAVTELNREEQPGLVQV